MAEFRELLALVSSSDLVDILKLMLDPQEFLSGYGISSISAYRQAHPYVLSAQYGDYSVYYGPGESTTCAFGRRSTWHGPICFPINFLLVEVLQKCHRFYGDDFLVEYPAGSGKQMSLGLVAEDTARRLHLLPDKQGF